MITLDKINLGSKAIVKKINSKGTIKRRLLDIGLIPGTKIENILESPGKDPIAYLIRGTLIALRKEDTKNIVVELV